MPLSSGRGKRSAWPERRCHLSETMCTLSGTVMTTRTVRALGPASLPVFLTLPLCCVRLFLLFLANLLPQKVRRSSCFPFSSLGISRKRCRRRRHHHPSHHRNRNRSRNRSRHRSRHRRRCRCRRRTGETRSSLLAERQGQGEAQEPRHVCGGTARPDGAGGQPRAKTRHGRHRRRGKGQAQEGEEGGGGRRGREGGEGGEGGDRSERRRCCRRRHGESGSAGGGKKAAGRTAAAASGRAGVDGRSLGKG